MQKKINHTSHKNLPHTPIIPLLNSADQLTMLHQILNRMGDQLVIIRSDGRILFANQVAIASYGYPPQEIINAPITKFMEEKMSIKEWRKNYFKKVKESKGPFSFVMRWRIKGNEIRTVEVTASLLKYEKDEFMVCIARDVTQRLELEQKLKESEDLYQHFTDQAADGIFTVDLNGYITYANQAAAQLIKLEQKILIKTHFAAYLARNSLVKAWQSFQKVIKEKTVVRDEANIKDKKGNIIPVEFTSTPIYKKGKVFHVHTIFRDITQRRNLENLVRESEKMKTLQDFISGMIHEIQNPLKIVSIGMTDMIEEYTKKDFEYIGYKEFTEMMKVLKLMTDQLNQCFDTMNKLVEVNKRKIGLKIETSDVNQIIEEALHTIEHQLDAANINVQMKFDKNLPIAAIDPIELDQVVTHILINALQSIHHAQGKLEIRTLYLKHENKIRIDCIDNGIGIPKENLPRVYDPFFTTKHKGADKNTGLGLAVVYAILKAHHGNIIITSSLRKGTYVKIFLPVQKAK